MMEFKKSIPEWKNLIFRISHILVDKKFFLGGNSKDIIKQKQLQSEEN